MTGLGVLPSGNLVECPAVAGVVCTAVGAVCTLVGAEVWREEHTALMAL